MQTFLPAQLPKISFSLRQSPDSEMLVKALSSVWGSTYTHEQLRVDGKWTDTENQVLISAAGGPSYSNLASGPMTPAPHQNEPQV